LVTAGEARVRRPAVAGSFYPSDPSALERAVRAHLAEAAPPEPGAPVPKALGVPHAGCVCSGPVGASAFVRLAPLRGRLERIVLLGPSHQVPFRGLAVPEAEVFETPLGPVEGDAAGGAAARGGPGGRRG